MLATLGTQLNLPSEEKKSLEERATIDPQIIKKDNSTITFTKNISVGHFLLKYLPFDRPQFTIVIISDKFRTFLSNTDP